MRRIIVNRSATLPKTFTFTPTGTPSVVVTSASTGLPITTGTVSGSAETWTYTIPASSNTMLDTYTETWSAVTGGESQVFTDVIEVAGGTLFTLAAARAIPALAQKDNSNNYRITDDQIFAARTEVEQRLEYELGFALVPRYTTETLDGDGGNLFMLSNPYIRALRSVSVSGMAYDSTALAAISVGVTGRVYSPTAWTSGYQNVVVGYEHGLSVPPGGAESVGLALAKRFLLGSPADDRATSMSTDEQVTTFYVPGAGEPFDVPAANRFVAAHTLRTGIA